tara:strand:+ start:19595 stop:21355 length:1761 start_codon:yes stop_codon:yes gene_type:complete
MIVVDEMLQQRFPRLNEKPWLSRPLGILLRWLLHEREFQDFAARYPHLTGQDFVEQVLDYFEFSYSVRDTERERIPSEGRVVIIANHPIGSLDGLVLIKLVSEIRPDVKVVANELLMAVKPLHDLLLPVNNMGGRTARENLRNIHKHLTNEGALIIFPAGEVSRLRPQGVRDTKWQDGFLRIANRTASPIVPVHLDGRNSPIFYSLSMLYKPMSTLLLVTEMFRQRERHLPVRIGELIPCESWQSAGLASKQTVKLFRKHLYRVASKGDPVFKTRHAIALPENRRELSRCLQESSERLGETGDGKIIYLHRHQHCSPVLRELGRLREISFRAVGEGTNQRRDIDVYDSHYFHLILWDAEKLEIAGAYRLGDARRLRGSAPGLYTATLFDYSPAMEPYLEQGLELGRGFVQPKYWGKRSLEYLWYGIGAFLQRYPGYRYLFGPVSISGSLPPAARSVLVGFYGLYFPPTEHLATASHPYIDTQPESALSPDQLFCGNDYSADFKVLKRVLADIGVTVPTLYKQYSELCKPGGVQFLAFGVDPAFNNCIDGLIMVDTCRLREHRRQRYMTGFLPDRQPDNLMPAGYCE